jgi:hypothetical protein
MSYFTLLKIWDGTNGPVAVKAASVQAAATDPSLVVQINPNQPNLTTPLNVSLAAGSLSIGKVVERPDSPVSANWTMTAFNVSAAGATTIVTGTGGKTTKIMRMITVNNGAIGITSTQVTIQDTAAAAMNGPITLTTSGVINMPGNGEPYFVSGTGAGIQINSSNVVQLCGTIWTEAN